MPGIGDLFRRVTGRSRREDAPEPDPVPLQPAPVAGESAASDATEPAAIPEPAPSLESVVPEPLLRPDPGPETQRPAERLRSFPAAGSAPTGTLEPEPATTAVAAAPAPAIAPDDDALHEDLLLVICPYCGLENQRVGARCGNTQCNQVIVRLPTWAQHRRQNWMTRRLSWRRIITACAIALFIVFVIWINYPFAPNPVVLLKNTQTRMTIDDGIGSWSAAGRDLRHSRYVDIGPPPPAGQIRVWNTDIPGEPLEAEPVAQDTHVYVGSSRGMYALRHHDLSLIERWEGDTPGRITGAAAVVGLNLFFGSTDHTVSSWDAYDGHVRWSFPAEDTVETAPMVADGLVYISSGEGWVYALDAHAGTPIWQTQLESNASDAVAIYEGRLFVGDEKGILYVLSARTGQEWFRYRTPRGITGAPVVSADGERAYFASGGQLYAVDAKVREIPGLYQFKQLWAQLWLWQVPGVPRPQGQQGGLWRFTPENPLQGVKSSPALAPTENGEALYVGGHDHNMYALDALDGSPLWTFEANEEIWASPLVVKDQLIFGDDSGILYSLHRETGTVNWTLDLGSEIRLPPVVSKGLLIVRTNDGTVFGIE